MTIRTSEKTESRSFFILLKHEVIAIFRVNDIIDLPLIDSITSQRICTIRDVIIDTRESKVYALVCREKLWKRSFEVVPFNNVTVITQNGVEIKGGKKLISTRELSIKQRRLQSYQSIMGSMVLGPRGETLGVVRDILIDTRNGFIKAYELSEGYIDDFLTGRHIVELDCGHTLLGKSVT